MTISILAQLDRDIDALDVSLASSYPEMKRPEINALHTMIEQLRTRMARTDAARADKDARANAELERLQARAARREQDARTCPRRAPYRTPAEAGRAALQLHVPNARVYSCAACGSLHLESASPEASARTEAA